MTTPLQFIPALIAALLGVFITRRLLGFPATLASMSYMAGYWASAVSAYLVPRAFSRVLRTRLLGSLLILSLLVCGLFLFATHLAVSVPLKLIFAPVLSIFLFCAVAFLTGSRRSWPAIALVLLPPVILHLVSLWWSYGFETGVRLKLAARQLIPLLAATATLVATDNLLKTGDR
jgi:hypothetical protein